MAGMNHWTMCRGILMITTKWLNNFLNNQLTIRSRVLLEKIISLQLVKNFPAFYGSWRFITALTSVPTCPCPGTDQSSPCPLSDLLKIWFYYNFPSTSRSSTWSLSIGFPNKTLRAPLLFSIVLHAPPISCFLFNYPHNIWRWIDNRTLSTLLLPRPFDAAIPSSAPYSLPFLTYVTMHTSRTID